MEAMLPLCKLFGWVVVHLFLHALLPRSQPVERVFFSVFNIWHIWPLFRGVLTGFTKMLFGAWTQWLTKWHLYTLKESRGLAFLLLLANFNFYICVLCPHFIRKLRRTTCCNYGYFKSCFDLQSLFSENLNFPCSLFYFFFFFNFKVSQNPGIGRNLECHVVWFLPLSSKWTGGQNWKLVYSKNTKK